MSALAKDYRLDEKQQKHAARDPAERASAFLFHLSREKNAHYAKVAGVHRRGVAPGAAGAATARKHASARDGHARAARPA